MPQMTQTRRLDYRLPDFLVDHVELRFDLDPTATLVTSKLSVRRHPDGDRAAPLRLDGEGLTLVSVSLDGEPMERQRFEAGHDGLTVADMPDAAVLEVVTRVDPTANTELSGLYMSGGNWFTQCEAEGFRRITYFPDRPDVMARFDVTLVGDPAAAPVLLSNGNPAGQGVLDDGRRWARWSDPHPKPSYLFALVAGQLERVSDHFVTASGRTVELGIYVRTGDQESCGHAMDSLKRAMAWDERVYGFEYDLDVFNIAAVSDFNMGAMENKGLNVFNTKYVLARPETATDGDLEAVESVIAHEYFHNWTGNRITCRDWFQLSLKEGLTVFRDQQFSADQGSAAVKRIGEVRRLRAAQFIEDAGPMAHPVRPDSYVAIDNFYTATVYEKGAEVVRMLHGQLGPERFRAGMDEYVRRHDNQAVTIEDFVAALSAGGGVDLSPFLVWYAQAGTPVVSMSDTYDALAHRYVLTLRQETPPTPGQQGKQAVPIPVVMGLLDGHGHEIATRDLLLDEAVKEYTFEGTIGRPVPSLLRGFSAPVRLTGLDEGALRHLAAHDTDPVVRWDSFQEYAIGVMLRRIADFQTGQILRPDPGLRDAIAATLAAGRSDPAFAATCVALPSESIVSARLAEEDPDAVHAVRDFLRRDLGEALLETWQEIYHRLSGTDPARLDGAAMGARSLRNVSLAYLDAAGEHGLVEAQFAAASRTGGNMTDCLAALDLLSAGDTAARVAALAAFYQRGRGDPLVLDKWFSIQGASPRVTALTEVEALWIHPDFDVRNPNRARALIAAFALGNPTRFHAADGSGYRFLERALLAIDAVNGQLAARLVNALAGWRRHTSERAALQKSVLERLAASDLSRFTAEKVALASPQAA